MRTLFSENLIFSPLLIWQDCRQWNLYLCVSVFLYFRIPCLSVCILCICIRISGVFAYSHHHLLLTAHQPAFTGKAYRTALTVSRSLFKWTLQPTWKGFLGAFPNFDLVFLYAQGGSYVWLFYYLHCLACLLCWCCVSMIGPYHCQPLICSKENLL